MQYNYNASCKKLSLSIDILRFWELAWKGAGIVELAKVTKGTDTRAPFLNWHRYQFFRSQLLKLWDICTCCLYVSNIQLCRISSPFDIGFETLCGRFIVNTFLAALFAWRTVMFRLFTPVWSPSCGYPVPPTKFIYNRLGGARNETWVHNKIHKILHVKYVYFQLTIAILAAPGPVTIPEYDLFIIGTSSSLWIATWTMK